jgi:hypothetical protein
VFADLHLPFGASVAVIALNEAVRRTLRKAGFKAYQGRRPRPDTQTDAEPALPTLADPVIDKQAFEPDARSLALLRGDSRSGFARSWRCTVSPCWRAVLPRQC